MRIVFADTYYFVALLSPHDQGHARAVDFTKTFRGRLITTEWVLMELGAALASSPQGRKRFIETRDVLRANPDARVIPCNSALMEEGVRLYGQRLDKQWSLTDCVSFVVMRR